MLAGIIAFNVLVACLLAGAAAFTVAQRRAAREERLLTEWLASLAGTDQPAGERRRAA